jgi:hypothetical protein
MLDASRLKETLRTLQEKARAGLKGVKVPQLSGPRGLKVPRLSGLKAAKLPARLKDVEKLAALPAKTLERERGRAGFWLLLYAAFLALLAFLNLFIRPGHPHFGPDGWFGFWPVFGLGVGLAMIFVMKRIVQPLIARKEDYYDDL